MALLDFHLHIIKKLWLQVITSIFHNIEVNNTQWILTKL